MAWNYAYTSAIWLPLGTILLFLALATYVWHRRSVPGVLPFTFALLFGALWAAGSALEYAAVDLAAKITWIKFQTAWQLPAVTAITCFVLEYAWPGRWLTRRNLILLSIVPLLIVLATLTDDLHHLLWNGFSSWNGSVIPQLGYLGWMAIVYSFGLVFLTLIVLGWLFLHSPQHRWPVAIMIAGHIGVRTIFVLDNADLLRAALPLDLLGLAFISLMYAIALFGFRLFDPIPLARQSAIEQMRDGMLVLDPQRRVVSLNPSAERILGASLKQVQGKLIEEMFPMLPDLNSSLTGAGIQSKSIEMNVGPGDETRFYEFEFSQLYDFRCLPVGCLFLLHDVTEQRRSQAQLLEQQRALAMLQEREQLAHELHDGIGQVLGYVKMQASAARGRLAQGQNEAADSQLAQLVAVAQDAHANVREYILGAKIGESSPFGFLPNLRWYLQRFSEQYLLHTELIAPPDWNDEALEATVAAQLLRIIQESLSNARKHALAQCVQVCLEREDGRARVIVQDDGVGFDPVSLKKDQPDHYGLRFMRERAGQIGGRVEIQSASGAGTRILIDVPVKG